MKVNYMKRFAAAMILGVSTLSLHAQSVDLYVAAGAKEGGNGSKKSPVSSIYAAKEMLVKKFATTPFTDATIWLAKGNYEMPELVTFDKGMFDGKNIAITIKSSDEEKAIISSGFQIPSGEFKPLKVSGDAERFHKDAIGKLVVADLSDAKYNGLFSQNMDDGSEGYRQRQNYSTLAFDDEIMRVACWPNRGYSHFKEILEMGPTTRWLTEEEKPEGYSLDNPTGGKFSIEEQADWAKWAKEFNNTKDVILEGYPNNDWFFQAERIGAINGDEIQLLRYTRYGIKEFTWMIPRRVKFVNLLCELDEAGEWYFDHKSSKLYIYPITPVKSKTEIRLLGENQLFKVVGMDNFKIENIVLRNGGKLGIEFANCTNSLIAGCDFQNFMGRAFSIAGGKNNGVVSNNFKGLGSVGTLNGGDIRNIIPCNHYMKNNMIHDCRLKGYGLVGLHGVGITFSNNLLYNLNGALNYGGSEILIEKNEFYNMGTEMNDWNVIYTGATWTNWGNVIKNNFAHHLMGMPSSAPIEAFRNDDMGMGTSYIGNVFYKAGKASLNFSGSGNDCVGNITLKTYSVWRAHFGVVGEEATKARWQQMFDDYDTGLKRRGDKDDFLWKTEKVIGKLAWRFEPFISKYPIFNKIMSEGSPWRNTFCVVKNNYLDGITDKNSGYTCYKAKPELMLEGSDWNYPTKINIEEAFVNPESLNFKFKDSFKPMDSFEPIPFEEIGLYKDEYRKTTPNKDEYRKAINERYKGVSASGRKYDKSTANTFYDVPAYLLK